jgi:hypothetical protein
MAKHLALFNGVDTAGNSDLWERFAENVDRDDRGDVSSNSEASRRSWIAKLTLRAICDCVSFCVGIRL